MQNEERRDDGEQEVERVRRHVNAVRERIRALDQSSSTETNHPL